MEGYWLDVAARAFLLPTYSHPHLTEPAEEGNRFVLIAYVIGQYESLRRQHVEELLSFGFSVPGRLADAASDNVEIVD